MVSDSLIKNCNTSTPPSALQTITSPAGIFTARDRRMWKIWCQRLSDFPNMSVILHLFAVAQVKLVRDFIFCRFQFQMWMSVVYYYPQYVEVLRCSQIRHNRLQWKRVCCPANPTVRGHYTFIVFSAVIVVSLFLADYRVNNSLVCEKSIHVLECHSCIDASARRQYQSL